ncbi:hypothetical protein EPUL_004412 [Erysiphe pulchra]|uniref:FAD/NAD(P)-binding domain-containing protein n=1 Tax=Erysiphe pulchra TaxID=225359 RepID=A0A2S4PN50_9PEZI|nr:hypothetical protein EPUL_004412 [Erysiphe pulchra]
MIINTSKSLVIVFFLFLILGSSLNSTLLRWENTTVNDVETLKTQYDVVIVGGGPAGLSALSSLARVRRSAILIDSGEYRNAHARETHDVIGSDGMAPWLFRSRAREQILRYPTVSLQNETVVSIVRHGNGSSFITTVSSGRKYSSRKIILATGIKDILPNTPGIKEAWGRGMYWCVWCDSWEHRDQSLGIIASLPNIIGTIYQVTTLNKDIIAFVNGTDTVVNRAFLNTTTPSWQKNLAKARVAIENRTIESIERLQDGSIVRNKTSWEEYDIFRVNLQDGTQIERGAFIMSFQKCQRSYLGSKIGVQLIDERIKVDPSNMRAAPGVWGIGDANSDGTTNVLHALYSGKKASVHSHIELATENAASSILKRSESEIFQEMDNDLENLWTSLQDTS